MILSGLYLTIANGPLKFFSFWSIWETCERIGHVDWGGELFTSATWFKEEIEKFLGSSKLDLKTVVLHTRSALVVGQLAEGYTVVGLLRGEEI